VTLDWEIIEGSDGRKLRLIWTEAGGPLCFGACAARLRLAADRTQRARPARWRSHRRLPPPRRRLHRHLRARTGRLGKPHQNIENNPMQSSRMVDTSSREYNLTRRANHRHNGNLTQIAGRIASCSARHPQRDRRPELPSGNDVAPARTVKDHRRVAAPRAFLARELRDPIRVVSWTCKQHRLWKQGAEENRTQPIVPV
jgi:hypothetical protein